MDEHNEFPDKPVFFTPGTKKCLCISIPCILVFMLIFASALETKEFSVLAILGLTITATFGFLPLWACVSEYLKDCRHYRESPEDYAEYKARRFAELKAEGERLERQYNPESAPKPKPSLTTCAACGNKISTRAESCPHCGEPTGVHICPKCGGTNTQVISGASKAGSIFLWGPYAANKVMSKYQCNDCGHKF